MNRTTKRIQRDDLKGATHIQLETYYSKGGMNYLSGRATPRGYFVSATPVTVAGNMVSFAMFSGHARLLFETKRFSERQFAQAVEMAKSHEDELIAAIVAENQAA